MGKMLLYIPDTDSVHTWLTIDELKQFCDIHQTELGKWKHEGTFKRARFLRSKCYIEEDEKKLHVTCAGLSKKSFDKVTFENFKTGMVIGTNLKFKMVEGGTLLVKSDFTIKDDMLKNEIRKF